MPSSVGDWELRDPESKILFKSNLHEKSMWFYYFVVVVLFLQALRCQDPQADNNDAFQTRTSNCLAVISLLFKHRKTGVI